MLLDEQMGVEEGVARLLSAAEGVSVLASRPATFLELTGRAHLEAVATNLLCFFLDPNAEHRLGHLFLDSLLAGLAPGGMSVDSVRTEVTTRNGKRLDLVVEADTHVIGIENKVLAAAYNPWRDYRDHLRELAGLEREPLLLLLAVHPPSASQLEDFVRVVSYRELMARARGGLGRFAVDTPAEYVTFARDFIRTMENRYVGSTMNPKMLELLREHPQAVQDLMTAVNEFRKHAAQMTGQLGTTVMEALGDGWPQKVEPRSFASRLRGCQVFEVIFPNASVAVDAYLTPEGWEISVHERSEPDGGQGPMEEWLRSLPLPKGAGAGGLTVEEYDRIVTARFPPETPVDVVGEHTLELVQVIASQPAAPHAGD